MRQVRRVIKLELEIGVRLGEGEVVGPLFYSVQGDIS